MACLGGTSLIVDESMGWLTDTKEFCQLASPHYWLPCQLYVVVNTLSACIPMPFTWAQHDLMQAQKVKG